MEKVPQYRVDELLDVQIRHARVRAVDDRGGLYLGYGAGNDELLVDPAHAAITVTRVAPAEWPPQAGDVWTDRDGEEWFARVETDGSDEYGLLVRANARAGYQYGTRADDVLASYGPMRLERRRGWTPTPTPTDAEPAEVDLRTVRAAFLTAFAEAVRDGQDVEHITIEIAQYKGVEIHTVHNSIDQVTAWTKLFGLPTPACTGKVYAGGGPSWQAYETRGEWNGLPIRVWTAADVTVDDPDDTGARTGCECDDCEDIEADQIDEAEAEAVAEPKLVVSDETIEAVGRYEQQRHEDAVRAEVEAAHYPAGGAAGGPGMNSVWCACEVTFAGFDTYDEAKALLDRHIADEVAAAVTA